LKQILADTGFLVALGIKRDPRHYAGREFLAGYSGELLVPAPVVSETCYFLSTAGKVRLLDWINQPRHKVLDLPEVAYSEVGRILAHYAALDPDFTDAAIVWLAQECGCSAILTVDVRDFSTLRVGRGRRFELVRWCDP
jgi:predicted nucleic acid-binding protein